MRDELPPALRQSVFVEVIKPARPPKLRLVVQRRFFWGLIGPRLVCKTRFRVILDALVGAMNLFATLVLALDPFLLVLAPVIRADIGQLIAGYVAVADMR